MIDSSRLAEMLSARFRLALTPESRRGSNSETVAVRASDIPSPNGFAIHVAHGWRSVEAEFAPDNFAGELIRAMGSVGEEFRRAFAKAADGFVSTGARVTLRINQTPVTDFGALPPAPWNSFELLVRRMSAAEMEGPEAQLVLADDVAAICLALVLALLPLDDDGDALLPLYESGLPEGAKSRVEVNRYERSPVNRAACIAIHGTACCACGMDFAAVYGAIGYGYIEIHHVVPVSRMVAGYVVDPRSDLIPLCANCHAMVHRRDPPITLDDLREFLRIGKRAGD